MYLKRNKKFLPDRWSLKTSPASQRSLNEIVFRSHERLVKSLSKVECSPKVNKFDSYDNLVTVRSLLGKKRIANFDYFLINPLCEVILLNIHVNGKRFRSTNFERPEKSSDPTDRAETLYFFNISFGYAFQLNIVFLWNTLLVDQQELLNLDIPWHNWLVLSSESLNIFCFVLFGIIRLQETFENKI
jgi:hypothetical protein